MREKNQRKWWLREGVFFVGHWEPLIFRRRKGSPTVDAAEIYEKEHTEETAVNLKNIGVTLDITHCHKGFGLQAEKGGEMEKAKELGALCHKHGLKIGYYIRPDTLLGETFFPMEPKAKDWLQVNQDGRHPTYGAYQTFRFKPCFNREEYMRYLEKIVRYAVGEMRADIIHFDDLNLSPNPTPATVRAPSQDIYQEAYLLSVHG